MNNKILFNKELYELEAIKQAGEEYRHIALIQTEIVENDYLCYIHKCNVDMDLVKKEFSNYVLALSIKLMRYMEE